MVLLIYPCKLRRWRFSLNRVERKELYICFYQCIQTVLSAKRGIKVIFIAVLQ